MSATIVTYTSEITCDYPHCPAVMGSHATWRMTTPELRAMADAMGWEFQALHKTDSLDLCPVHRGRMTRVWTADGLGVTGLD